MGASEKLRAGAGPELTGGKEIDLSGKVAIVTGSSRGIGRAIALKLGYHGANIVLNSREQSREQVAEVRSLVESFGQKAIWIPGDVREESTARAIAETTVKEFGRIDILINNAGLTKDSLLIRMSEEDWDLVLDTNARGAFLVTRAVLRYMRRNSGSIINISSVAGQMGNPGQANYAASKAGLEGFTRAVAQEYGSRGIRVNAVALGFVETDLTAHVTEEQRRKILSRVPLGRSVTPEEAADAVLFLVSDRASGITGQVLNVDGGMTS